MKTEKLTFRTNHRHDHSCLILNHLTMGFVGLASLQRKMAAHLAGLPDRVQTLSKMKGLPLCPVLIMILCIMYYSKRAINNRIIARLKNNIYATMPPKRFKHEER